MVAVTLETSESNAYHRFVLSSHLVKRAKRLRHLQVWRVHGVAGPSGSTKFFGQRRWFLFGRWRSRCRLFFRVKLRHQIYVRSLNICFCTSGGGARDSQLTAVRAVPKFLQGYAHLLGRKRTGPVDDDEEEEEAQLATDDEGEETKDRGEEEDQVRAVSDFNVSTKKKIKKLVRLPVLLAKNDHMKGIRCNLKTRGLLYWQEALEQAVMENPELVEHYPQLKAVADRARANQAKEKGNRAFAAKQYETAVEQFTEAISLHEDAVFFSNRAAAHHALKLYRKAVEDAKQAIRLKRDWFKGWSRLAAAHFALEEWSEVRSFNTAARSPSQRQDLRCLW